MRRPHRIRLVLLVLLHCAARFDCDGGCCCWSSLDVHGNCCCRDSAPPPVLPSLRSIPHPPRPLRVRPVPYWSTLESLAAALRCSPLHSACDAGPYKINGVPLRRLNQAYVIATSASVDVSKVDVSKIDDSFFVKKGAKKSAKKDGESFFAKDSASKTPVDPVRKAETARVDSAIRAVVKATPDMKAYLNAKFTLTRGQKPHAMKF